MYKWKISRPNAFITKMLKATKNPSFESFSPRNLERGECTDERKEKKAIQLHSVRAGFIYLCNVFSGIDDPCYKLDIYAEPLT